MSFRVPSHVHHRQVHGEVVILDANTDRYLGLNSTGAAVWDVLAGGGSVADAIDLVTARFSVPQEIARDDVNTLVHELIDKHLLESVEA